MRRAICGETRKLGPYFTNAAAHRASELSNAIDGLEAKILQNGASAKRCRLHAHPVSAFCAGISSWPHTKMALPATVRESRVCGNPLREPRNYRISLQLRREKQTGLSDKRNHTIEQAEQPILSVPGGGVVLLTRIVLGPRATLSPGLC